MKTSIRYFLAFALAALVSLVSFSVGAAAGAETPPAAIVVDTPSAPHPKARIRSVDFTSGTILFDWLNADGTAADSGNSLARFTVTGTSITAEQKAILAGGITAATASP